MVRRNFVGWLLLSLLPLFAFIWMALAQHHAANRAPVDVDQVSAELARSVSYGLVEQPFDSAPGVLATSDSAAPEHTAVVSQPVGLRPATGL